jgi:hypothetical protein
MRSLFSVLLLAIAAFAQTPSISDAAGQVRIVLLCGKHFIEALRDYPELDHL